MHILQTKLVIISDLNNIAHSMNNAKDNVFNTLEELQTVNQIMVNDKVLKILRQLWK